MMMRKELLQIQISRGKSNPIPHALLEYGQASYFATNQIGPLEHDHRDEVSRVHRVLQIHPLSVILKITSLHNVFVPRNSENNFIT